MRGTLLMVFILIFINLIAAIIFPMPPVMYGTIMGSSIICITIIVSLYNLIREKKH